MMRLRIEFIMKNNGLRLEQCAIQIREVAAQVLEFMAYDGLAWHE
jgi:hypothetical protein